MAQVGNPQPNQGLASPVNRSLATQKETNVKPTKWIKRKTGVVKPAIPKMK